MTWNDVTINLKPPTCTRKDAFHVKEQLFFSDKTDCIAKILNSKYKPANLKQLTDNLYQLNSDIFDRMLGLWKGSLYKIELQDNAKPHHARPQGIPHAYNKMFKQEVEWLCEVGVLRKINRSEWAAPTFLIPKQDCSV